MIGDWRGFGMDDERSSKHGESPWVCPTCGCPRSASKRLEPQKPEKIKVSREEGVHIFGATYWGEFIDRMKEIEVEVEE